MVWTLNFMDWLSETSLASLFVIVFLLWLAYQAYRILFEDDDDWARNFAKRDHNSGYGSDDENDNWHTTYDYSNSTVTGPRPLKEALTVFVGSWNMKGIRSSKDIPSLEKWLLADHSHDVYVIGVQGCDYLFKKTAYNYEEWFKKVESHLGHSYARLGAIGELSSALIILIKRKHKHSISAIEHKKHILCSDETSQPVACALAISFLYEDTSFCFMHMDILELVRFQLIGEEEEEAEKGKEKEQEKEREKENEKEKEKGKIEVICSNNVEGLTHEEVMRWKKRVRHKLLKAVIEEFRMGTRYNRDLQVYLQFDYQFCLGDLGYPIDARHVSEAELSRFVDRSDWAGLYQRADGYVIERLEREQKKKKEEEEEQEEGDLETKKRNGYHSSTELENEGKEKEKENDREREEEKEEEEEERENEKEEEEESEWLLSLMNEGVGHPPTSSFEQTADGSWCFSAKEWPRWDSRIFFSALPNCLIDQILLASAADGTSYPSHSAPLHSIFSVETLLAPRQHRGLKEKIYVMKLSKLVVRYSTQRDGQDRVPNVYAAFYAPFLKSIPSTSIKYNRAGEAKWTNNELAKIRITDVCKQRLKYLLVGVFSHHHSLPDTLLGQGVVCLGDRFREPTKFESPLYLDGKLTGSVTGKLKLYPDRSLEYPLLF